MSMPGSDPKRIGLSADVKPHAYDPATQPELFEGVLARRVVAFLIDVIIIAVPLILLAVFMAVFTVFTLGLGAFVFFLYGPIATIWALVYYGLTFGSAASATIGMRMVDLEMRTWYGAPVLFRARRGARHRLLAQRHVPDAVHPACGAVQRPQEAPARHAGRHHRHQQPGARQRATQRPV